ncbi:MAG: pyrroloquinoline quinone biosynthesis peptide chaperone PqqD [Candidatus Porifericomitaceae bacterium WSBS_2022_MAG_OTU9]
MGDDLSSTATAINELPDDAIPHFLPTFRFQWEEAQQCYVVLYPEGMVKLNQSAGEILKRCDGKSSIAEIAEQLVIQFDGSNKWQVKGEIANFVTHAMQRGWLGV